MGSKIHDYKELLLSRVFHCLSGCWLWTGGLSGKRYGSLGYYGKSERAHRASYKEFVGPIPEGLHVMHTCDNTICINPKHLVLGTHTENMQDKIKKGRDQNQKKTHCPHGHEYSGDNLYLHPDGSRKCRTCLKEASIKFDSNNREKRRKAALDRYYKMKAEKGVFCG